MSSIIRNSLLVAPALLGAIVLASGASAAETSTKAAATVTKAVAPTLMAATPVSEAPAPGMTQVYRYANEGAVTQQSQVTSVSQLSDVRPTDWAFQALQSLVERYGCIVGYPDKTYRGSQALSRYEFAAGLNSCLDRVNELIAAGTADLVKKEDLAVLQRLQEEFGAELATLRGRVDALDARTATLEKQQFSTTTKLSGEVIFNISDTLGDAVRENGSRAATSFSATTTAANGRFVVNGANTTPTNPGTARRDDLTNTIFSDRVRLSFDTSFTGKDRLRTRLQAGNTPSYAALTRTNTTKLSFDFDNGNAILVDKLNYRFPLGDKLRVQIDAINTEFNAESLITTLSPFESSALGSVSRFGRYNAFYRSGNPNAAVGGSAGITAAFKLTDNFRVEAGYVSDPGNTAGTSGSNNPGIRNGLFNGSYAALGQLVFTSKAFSASVGYARSYFTRSDSTNLTGITGSYFAADPFGAGLNGQFSATASDAVSVQGQFKLTPGLILGGWYSVDFAHQLGTNNDATIQTGAVYAAFPDFGKKGNLLGLLAGIPPKVTKNDNAFRRDDRNTAIHLEAFYRYRLNDNIAITPGLFVLFNPENNNSNATQYVGTIRTTFTF